MSTVKAIQLVSKVNQKSKELKKSSLLEQGARHVAEADTFYEFVVDGKPGLPKGTKVIKRENELAFELPDGRTFEIANWCGVNNSQIADLLTTQVLDEASGKWIEGVEAITSKTCAWVASNGTVSGIVGAAEASSAGLWQALTAVPLAGLALASGGGASGPGDSAAPSGLLSPPTRAVPQIWSPITTNLVCPARARPTAR
jgi:hypothetical protein